MIAILANVADRMNSLLEIRGISRLFGVGMSATKTRYLYLDGARLIAALGVAAWHVRNAPRLDQMNIINLHYTIVDFFFVLSGFVLWPTLKRLQVAAPESEALSNFLWKRFLRLWPFSFLVLTATLAFVSMLLAYEHVAGVQGADAAIDERPLAAWPVALMFLQIFSHAAWAWCVPLWSLSALWWATVVTVLVCRYQRVRFDVALLVIGTVTVVACILHNPENLDATYGLSGFARALIGLNLGIIVRRVILQRALPSRWILGVIATLAFTSLLIADTKTHGVALVIAPWAMLTAVLLLAGMSSDGLSDKKANLLSEMGKYSFPLFIWHVLVLQIYGDALLLAKIPDSSIVNSFQVKYAVVVSVTLVIASFSMRKLEPPIERALSKLGEKYLPFTRVTKETSISQ